MTAANINLIDFSDSKIRTLHLSWVAFFISFVVWFSHAPLMVHIQKSLGLTTDQVKALLILNVALTIPARIVVGMLVDRFGPRAIYSSLLIVSGFVCLCFASARSFEQLAAARFALGFVGAGFVIGIRMVGEWFPARQVGLAEGIYGGWGNFGSAVSAIALPTLALVFGGEDGWRWAVACTGLMAGVYGVYFYRKARNSPKGSTYFKPKKNGGLEVTSRGDFYLYLAMNVPMYLAMALLTWKLSPSGVGLLGSTTCALVYAFLVGLFGFQTSQIYRVNRHIFEAEVPEMHRYSFKQVAVLDIAYLTTFGSELAVISMLPLFFLETFEGLDPVKAGLLASGFAVTNLVARPVGGWLSDRFGRRRTLTVLVAGLSAGYFVLGQISGSWPIALAVLATMVCSFVVQAGDGAVFAVVPLVKRRMTGQIAGMAGAYGNVGAVLFLTALSFLSYAQFFLLISACAIITLLSVQFMDEPQGHLAEIAEDGTLQLVEMA
jgi:NNP family nitrate/nitrite transporter-like MFS transporter